MPEIKHCGRHQLQVSIKQSDFGRHVVNVKVFGEVKLSLETLRIDLTKNYDSK